jgi:hypothetical protein
MLNPDPDPDPDFHTGRAAPARRARATVHAAAVTPP